MLTKINEIALLTLKQHEYINNNKTNNITTKQNTNNY